MKTVQIDTIAKIMLQIRSVSEMTEFLKGLLTQKELEEIVKRIQIVKKLKEGIPQHTIARELGVGIATVTRGSKELQKGRFKQVLSSKF